MTGMLRLPAPETWKGVAGLAVVFLAWWLSVPLVGLPDYFYPSPTSVWRAFIELVEKGILPIYVLDSLGRYALGLFLASALGLSIGLAIGLSKTVGRILEPIVSFLYALIEIAWLPILILWFGFSLTTILIAIVYVVIWPILYNAITGVRALPTVYINAALSMGASRVQIIREVILPGIMPSILTGFRVAAGFAFRALILAEILAAKTGLGYLVFESAANLQTDRTIVGMICMGLMWLFIDHFYLKPLELATVHRWGQVVTAADHD
jgi:ABC-type nitrate/sulfonate/bicarbonate transport system permease component